MDNKSYYVIWFCKKGKKTLLSKYPKYIILSEKYFRMYKVCSYLNKIMLCTGINVKYEVYSDKPQLLTWVVYGTGS